MPRSMPMAGAFAPFILVGILKCSGDLKLSFLLLGSAIISKVYPGLVRPQSVGKGGLDLKSTKLEHIFVAVITFFPPFFCGNTFDTSLLLVVCALK